MIETLKRHWWVPVIRGIAAIVFGVIAFTHPVMAIATLVLFFRSVGVDRWHISSLSARSDIALQIRTGDGSLSLEFLESSWDSSRSTRPGLRRWH